MMMSMGIGSASSARSGKDEPDDLLELLILANKNLKGIKIIFDKHQVVIKEPGVKKLIGYFPSGEFQIIFEKGKKRISCIRGAVSFGQYEILAISGVEMMDPERFSDPKDVIKRIRALLYD